jgi:hypothetical protein
MEPPTLKKKQVMQDRIPLPLQKKTKFAGVCEYINAT